MPGEAMQTPTTLVHLTTADLDGPTIIVVGRFVVQVVRVREEQRST